MILLTREFDQNSTAPKITAPPGSTIINARMSRMGQCLVTLSCPEGELSEVDYELLFLFEDVGNVGGGDPSGWRYVGGWLYNNSREAHLFVRQAPVVVQKKTKAARLTERSK